MSLYKFNPTIAGGFIGAIAQVLVIFGIHWGLFPIIFSNIEKFGFDTILAVFGPSIIAQSGAAFGVWLKTKDKRLNRLHPLQLLWDSLVFQNLRFMESL